MKNYFIYLVLIFSFLYAGIIFSQVQGLKIESPAVDGKLSNIEWAGAKVFTNFYRFIPKSEDNSYDSTIVYIKQTKDAIYFGFDYFPKGKIISKSLTRDRSTEDENEFFILLDLENKNQNGYFFSFSFLNNQRDAVIYNQRNQSNEWDWVWDVKSNMIVEPKDGKTGHIQTEVRIPVDRLQNKNKKQIGVDVQMFSYKEDGTYYYYSLVPDAELLSLKNMYKLDLRTPFDEKLNLNFNIIPFAVGQTFNNDRDTVIFGGDFNVSLDKHKLKATYNPDESTLEADPFRFSLYSRPIFLQEKRTFFSKDLDLFRTPINLFYTRAIEDLKYGFNYTYRSDVFKAGAVFADDLDENGFRRNFFIARPKFNFKDINVGSLFIHSKNFGTEYDENIISFDGSYRFPENPLRFQFQVASSSTSLRNTSEQGTAYNLYSYYQYNDAGGPYADVSYNRVNPGFYASTYFNSQTGLANNFDEVNISGGYKFVFDRKYLNDINVSSGYYKLKSLKSDDFYPASFNFQNNWYVNSNYKVSEFLRFDQYFEYNIPNGFNDNGELITYTNTAQSYNASFFLGTNYLNLGYYFGPYFGSFIENPSVSGNVFLFERLALSATLNFVNIGDLKRTILNTRLDWKVINKLYLRSYFQRDNLTQQALWNSILQYEFFAGSSAYLVVNMNGDRLQNVGKYFKVGYDFTF
ncbi:MAG: hypothetical protein M3R36_15385 [Bacteroidota bacterium]|nr:hypothetical protein [Bacteroidota bacterium]